MKIAVNSGILIDPKNKIFEKMLKMGVTTAIGGNCGIDPNNIKEYLDTVESCI